MKNKLKFIGILTVVILLVSVVFGLGRWFTSEKGNIRSFIEENWLSILALILSAYSLYLYKWRLKKELEINAKEKHFEDIKNEVLIPLNKNVSEILVKNLKIVSESFPYVWYLKPENKKEFLKCP